METNIIHPAEDCIKDLTIKNFIFIEQLDDLKIETYSKIGVGDLLNYIEVKDIIPFITKIKSKLIKGGIITLEGIDLYELSLAVVNDRIGSIDYNNIIKNKKQILSILDIIDIMNKSGLKILSRDIDAIKYHVEVTNE